MIRMPLVWVSVAVAVLAGCSSDTPPSALPPVSPAPVASPSPSPAPSALPQVPGLPTVAQSQTAAGAAAFARYFYEQIPVAFAARDPSVLAAMSAPQCKSCARFVDSVSQTRKSGERVEFSNTVVASVAPALDVGRPVQVDLVYDSSALAVYDSKGRVIKREPVLIKRQVSATLTWSANRWSILELAGR